MGVAGEPGRFLAALMLLKFIQVKDASRERELPPRRPHSSTEAIPTGDGLSRNHSGAGHSPAALCHQDQGLISR